MAGTEITVTDGYGRRVVFAGELLTSESTDTPDHRKPQWLDIDVWRTEAGSFVVRRAVHYRVVHASRDCSRLEGYDAISAEPSDTYPCRSCNPSGVMTGWGQDSQVYVDVWKTPAELIKSMAVDGRYTRLSRTLLADLSEQDDRIDAEWNTVVVP
jgi:hypothetical protein